VHEPAVVRQCEPAEEAGGEDSCAQRKPRVAFVISLFSTLLRPEETVVVMCMSFNQYDRGSGWPRQGHQGEIAHPGLRLPVVLVLPNQRRWCRIACVTSRRARGATASAQRARPAPSPRLAGPASRSMKGSELRARPRDLRVQTCLPRSSAARRSVGEIARPVARSSPLIRIMSSIEAGR